VTGGQREQRALSRARRAAQAAEDEDLRMEERRQRWLREGTYMSRAEVEAGEPCRGCGEPFLDSAGDWPPLLQLNPEQRAEYDRAEAAFRERHAGCRAGRWSLAGHRAEHCSYCCPPPPMSDLQAEQVTRVLSSVYVATGDLDAWDLMLTCGHVVRRTWHRDHGDRYGAAVTGCPVCAERRRIVTARRAEPAADRSGQAGRDRLTSELAAAHFTLDRQRKAVEATERRIAGLTRKLAEPPGEPGE
jgi:hypothetical protein